MISVEDARRIIASHVDALDAVESGLPGALGAALAEDLVSGTFHPPADLATMDGYAIGGGESPGTFRVAGEIPAGKTPDRALGKGEAVRIFTGAPLPPGGGRVVMQEDVEREGDQIVIRGFSENLFIRPKGSEAKPGDVVLPAGTKLNAAELSILAQVGAVRPKVIRRPVIRHLASGSELVAPEETPAPGQIRDTNSTLLAGLLKSLGVESFRSSRVADDPAAIADAAGGEWDLLLLSGGASVGDYDFGAGALRRLGFTIHFDRVNLRPGKPLTFATRGRQAAFVIPGNPVSHFVCFHIAIRLAVERLAGLPPHWNFLPLETSGSESLRPGPRDTFWPATLSIRDGNLAVSPKRWTTSGDTFSLAGANALVRVNTDASGSGPLPTLLLDLS